MFDSCLICIIFMLLLHKNKIIYISFNDFLCRQNRLAKLLDIQSFQFNMLLIMLMVNGVFICNIYGRGCGLGWTILFLFFVQFDGTANCQVRQGCFDPRAQGLRQTNTR